MCIENYDHIIYGSREIACNRWIDKQKDIWKKCGEYAVTAALNH